MAHDAELPKGCFIVGNKLMGVCGKCGKIVRIDKPIFGSFHLCASDEDEGYYEYRPEKERANPSLTKDL